MLLTLDHRAAARAPLVAAAAEGPAGRAAESSQAAGQAGEGQPLSVVSRWMWDVCAMQQGCRRGPVTGPVRCGDGLLGRGLC